MGHSSSPPAAKVYVGMSKVINALGIEAMPNTNYLNAARRVIGMT